MRKAVLPVAGLGTRFLPATKVVPKELLPIVDVPCVQVVVEECVASGIEQIIFVTARGKETISDHFDRVFELESVLERRGKEQDLAAVRRLSQMAKFISVRQPEALGLGHAVLCAKEAVGDEPFAVVLGDDLVTGDVPGIKQLVDLFAQERKGVVGLQEVPAGQEHLYGIVSGEKTAGEGAWRLKSLVEKPAPGTAPSRLAIIGRYVLPPEIFPILEGLPPGRGGEIQLTDALARLCERQGLFGQEIRGERFDAGDRVGHVLATVYFALRRGDIGAEVKAGVERLLKELGPR